MPPVYPIALGLRKIRQRRTAPRGSCGLPIRGGWREGAVTGEGCGGLHYAECSSTKGDTELRSRSVPNGPEF